VTPEIPVPYRPEPEPPPEPPRPLMPPAPLFTPTRDRDPFALLFEQRTVFMRGPLDDAAADAVVAQLLALDAESGDRVRLLIDSRGGDAFGMFAIHDAMAGMRAPVDTTCLGLAASAGAFLLATGTGVRRAGPNARVLLHQPLGGGRGGASDVQTLAGEMVALRERMVALLAERSGQPRERIHADIQRDFWLSAEEAVAYGLIDEVGLGA